MKSNLTRLIDDILAWPAGDQAELAAYARKIRARREHLPTVTGNSNRNPPTPFARSAADRQIETFWQRRGG